MKNFEQRSADEFYAISTATLSYDSLLNFDYVNFKLFDSPYDTDFRTAMYFRSYNDVLEFIEKHYDLLEEYFNAYVDRYGNDPIKHSIDSYFIIEKLKISYSKQPKYVDSMDLSEI